MFYTTAKFIPCFIFLFTFCNSLFSGEAAYAPTVTKDWQIRDGDQAQTPGKPICMFIWASGGKGANPNAAFLESANFLGNDEVQKVLKNFTCIKIDVAQKADKMPKKWPKEIINQAQNYRLAVLLLSCDLTKQMYFKKGATDGNSYEAVAKTFLAAANSLLKIESQKKQNAEKDPKKITKEPPPPDDKPIKIPGLEDPETKKPDEKKPDSKRPNTPKDE